MNKLNLKWSLLIVVSLLVSRITALPVMAVPSRVSQAHRKAWKFARFHTKSRFDQVIENMFEKSDVDRNGKINFQEFYSLVMKLYVYLNRQAPVPPPTRQTLQILFDSCDANNSGGISKTEFVDLSHALGRRAFFRVTTCTLVRLAGAPILAEYTMRRLEGKSWPLSLAQTIVPKRVQGKILPIITTQAFGRSALIVLFVSTLGNTVVGGVNYILQQTLPGEEEYL